jgi:hypothetical protein
MYRVKDIESIEKNIDKIKDDAAKEYKSLYEPTLKEISDVYSAIRNYIKKKGKVAYGGFAQNILLTAKNPDESFYKIIDGAFYNWPDVADMEFYSPSPIADIIELTEELHSMGFKHVEGKEGIHPETYKIFVNFINYCDISYMPANIYNNMPIVEVNDIKCAHPHFMMVDAYRVINDPMTSYWRLDKSIKRFQKLLKYYPIGGVESSDEGKSLVHELAEKKIELKSNLDVLKVIRKKIIHMSDLVVVGFYAFDYLVKKVSDILVLNKYPFYEAISKDLEKDSNKTLKVLTNKFGNKITTKEFYPFFSFMDKRIEFYYQGNLVFRLFGNNERCTVYNYSEKKQTHFGTYNLVFMYLLFDYFLAFILRDKRNTELYQILIATFFDARNKYLNSKNLTVLDKSPFQDFTFQCYGIPSEPMRNALLQGLEKKKQGKQMKFRYGPSGKPGRVPDFQFSNSSGNQILNKKYLILKK